VTPESPWGPVPFSLWNLRLVFFFPYRLQAIHPSLMPYVFTLSFFCEVPPSLVFFFPDFEQGSGLCFLLTYPLVCTKWFLFFPKIFNDVLFSISYGFSFFSLAYSLGSIFFCTRASSVFFFPTPPSAFLRAWPGIPSRPALFFLNFTFSSFPQLF